MRVAIMMMATDFEPSTRNVKAFVDTVVSYYDENRDKFKNEYDFYIYSSSHYPFGIDDACGSIREKRPDPDKHPSLYELIINEHEDIYHTFEKTVYAFSYIHSYRSPYDLYVRVNISMFLNMDLLDSVADKLKPGCIYCNAINSYINASSKYVNDLYGRGDLLIFDHSVIKIFLEKADNYMYEDVKVKDRCGIDHVDDCMLGLCFIDGVGKDYYKRIYMLNYNYIPEYNMDENVERRINRWAIGSRVKTVPQEIGYSGYSWEDNEWRVKDAEKMRKLDEYYRKMNFDYNGVKFADVLVDKKNSRPTLFVQMGNVNVYDVFWKYLEQKR